MKNKKHKLYELELHEVLEFTRQGVKFVVTRVPGGWVYYSPALERGTSASVFVPFSQEFLEKW